MERLVTKPKNGALIAFSDPTPASEKSFRNLYNVSTASVRNLNPVTILSHSYLVLENPEAAVAILATRANKLGKVKSDAEKTEKVEKAEKTKKPARAKKAAPKTK